MPKSASQADLAATRTSDLKEEREAQTTCHLQDNLVLVAEVVEPRGRLWGSTGVMRGGKMLLHLEELL